MLQLIISDYLYSEFPDIREGPLTQYRSTLVKGKCLIEVADKLNLATFLRVSGFDSKRAPQELPSSREDALEALIGAIYLDSDLGTTKHVVLNWYGNLKERLIELEQDHNPKGRLQEMLQQKMGNEHIQYKVIEETGPPHERIFRVELTVGGQSFSKAKGRSKKEAEEKAARKALDTLDSFELPDV